MSTAALKAAATGAVAKKPENIGELSKFLADRLGQIKSVVAKNVTPEKMARIALNELRSNSCLLKIAIQNPGSFVNAVVQASHLGLEIGGALGQAYLVPFKGEIKMMPGYRGLISLSRRSGEISSINAEIVYENDIFDLELGLQTKVTHKPNLNVDRGDPKLVYMVAHFKDGGSHFEWMTVAEVMKIKARSSAVKAGGTTPWDTDRDEMIKKTIIRRGWKYLPMSIEMQNLDKIEAANDEGKPAIIESDGSLIIDESTGEIIGGDQGNQGDQQEKPEDSEKPKKPEATGSNDPAPATNSNTETPPADKQKNQQAADDDFSVE